MHTLRPGQRVIAPYTLSDGTCDRCREGFPTLCRAGGFFGGREDGGQGEAVRVPLAEGTLVAMPGGVDLVDDRLAAALATLTDVMGTGHHGALASGVGPGGTVAIVGDGAVGLCAVLAARRLGAERVIMIGHHGARLAMAEGLGATDIVAGPAEAAVERVRELTDGGCRHVVECVGTAEAYATAIGSARAGGTVGHLGSPVAPLALRDVHIRNVRLTGGRAPVRLYISELMDDVLAGRLWVVAGHGPDGAARRGPGGICRDGREARRQGSGANGGRLAAGGGGRPCPAGPRPRGGRRPYAASRPRRGRPHVRGR